MTLDIPVYIGIDNGVTGSIGVIYPNSNIDFFIVPTKRCLNYTKHKSYITRINEPILESILFSIKMSNDKIFVAIERPMVNPGRFKASTSALRSLEATLIALEKAKIDYIFLDSKEWQKEIFSSDIKGSAFLKQASLEVGNRLFPKYKDHKMKDRDGLLIAEYCRRKKL